MNGPELLVPITFFLSLAAVLITLISSRHRERIRMIEKGMSSEDVKALYARDVRRDPMSSLKWGILFVLAGLAIMLGGFLHDHYFVDEDIIIGMVCLFVGAGLFIFYLLASKSAGRTGPQ